MKFGFVLPSGDARAAADLAYEAEQAGWDGFFVWEPVWGVDAWVCLTAAAMRTERIRLGTMITPLSRMRPWDLAGKSATLDNLSGGRVVIAVGLGAVDTGFEQFGEETDRRTRAELVDEGLDIVTGLWRGQPFNYDGKHYKVREIEFNPPPPPVQQPRIPLWVVGAWPRMKSMRRVLKYDGLLPTTFNAEGGPGQGEPSDLTVMKAWIDEHRDATTPFDYIVEGTTSGNDRERALAKVRPWAEAGATWFNEARWGVSDPEVLLRRIRHGPPRLD